VGRGRDEKLIWSGIIYQYSIIIITDRESWFTIYIIYALVDGSILSSNNAAR